MPDTLRAVILGLLVSAALAGAGAAQGGGAADQQPSVRAHSSPARQLSPMGQRARRIVEALNRGDAAAARTARQPAQEPGEEDEQGGPGPLEDGGELPGGNQGEL